jgi:hypothetical protein
VGSLRGRGRRARASPRRARELADHHRSGDPALRVADQRHRGVSPRQHQRRSRPRWRSARARASFGCSARCCRRSSCTARAGPAC